MKNFLYSIILCLFFVLANDLNAQQQAQLSLELETDKIYSKTECYTIIKQLGEGAFGTVFSVKNSKDEPFAIKSYKVMESDFGPLADAEREFSRGQLFNHPNIIKSFDLFSYNFPSNQIRNNLVLELVEGRTLYRTEKGVLSKHEAISAMINFCEALRYALSLNLMHLDLHEDNIMLDNDAKIMVIDLASFYSFDELFNYANSNDSEITGLSSYREMPIGDSQGFLRKAPKVNGQAQKIPVNKEKLKQFFQKNPLLLDQLKQNGKLIPKHQPLKQQIKREGSLIQDSSEEFSPTEMDLIRMHGYYFDSLTEMCINILTKSNMAKMEKINMKAEIKKLAWSYAEDVADGEKIPVDHYLDRLLEVLNSFS